MRPIFTSYSSGTRKKDLWLNFVNLVNPVAWFGNGAIKQLKEGVLSDYPELSKNIFTYNYARSGMYEFFKAIGAGDNSEVLYQSFTCVAAVNPAIWAGFKPVFADIKTDNFSYDLSDLESKISNNTKVIVVQHTFGIAVDLKPIRELADRNGLLILEDCAQIYGNKEIGKYSDAVIFSFGRDKPIGGVNGGALVVNNQELASNVADSYEALKGAGFIWNFRQAVFQIVWGIVRGVWTFEILSKGLHWIFTKLGLLSRATSAQEKKLIKPKYIPARLSNLLATITLSQFNDRNEILNSRKSNVNYYYERLFDIEHISISPSVKNQALVRFPILTEQRDQLLKYLSINSVQGGDWYSTPIAPIEVDPSILGYKSCAMTETANSKILNLPTHSNIGEKERERIVDLILDFYKEDVPV